MNNRHLIWIIPVLLFMGFCIGYVTGMNVIIFETIDHLDYIDSINLNFNETKMVEALMPQLDSFREMVNKT